MTERPILSDMTNTIRRLTIPESAMTERIGTTFFHAEKIDRLTIPESAMTESLSFRLADLEVLPPHDS